MYFRYSAGVVAPMQRTSPRDSAGFRMLAASSDPSAEPAPTSVCSSSMKTMMFGFLGQLLHDRLETLLELTAVLRPRDDQRYVERQQAPVGQKVRYVAVDNPLREPLDDCGLPDPRLADQHRVVLGPAAEHLLHPLHLHDAADERVEQVLRRRRRQVPAELGQQRRLLVLDACRACSFRSATARCPRGPTSAASPSRRGRSTRRNAPRAGCRAAGARSRCSCAAADPPPPRRTGAPVSSRR